MRRFSLLPLASYGVVIAYACYAWFHLGHWPYYAHPDPKELPHRALLNIASVAFLAGLFSLLVIPLGYGVWRGVLTWRKQAATPHHGPLAWYSAGLALWVLDLVAEFSRVPWTSNIGWLLD
jgi:hypothetical protein